MSLDPYAVRDSGATVFADYLILIVVVLVHLRDYTLTPPRVAAIRAAADEAVESGQTVLCAQSRQVHINARTMSKSLFTLLLLISSTGFAEDVQVSLRSDKSDYELGEIVHLSYEVLWLGSGDGQMRFSSKALPEIEVLYLNKFLVNLTETAAVETLRGPSRHEKATFAPTMSRLSNEFAINDADAPTRFLNGKRGYYQFDRPGTYVIRAVFRADPQWRLFEGQDVAVRSTAIAIKIRE